MPQLPQPGDWLKMVSYCPYLGGFCLQRYVNKRTRAVPAWCGGEDTTAKKRPGADTLFPHYIGARVRVLRLRKVGVAPANPNLDYQTPGPIY